MPAQWTETTVSACASLKRSPMTTTWTLRCRCSETWGAKCVQPPQIAQTTEVCITSANKALETVSRMKLRELSRKDNSYFGLHWPC
eukprot:1544844-Amphidinium_carterae.1